MLRLSIVVPTCGRVGELARCLRRLLPESQKDIEAGSYEILVTDDNHSDSGKRVVEGEGSSVVRWFAGPKMGPASNRNSGARHARGEWLVFIDDDCMPDSHLLRSYLAAASGHPQGKVFEGRIAADRSKRHPLEESPLNEKGGNLWSCNFMISRELFLKVGGFDEKFPHAAGEDWELCYRLRKAGEVIRFVPEALVVHPWRRESVASFWRQHGRFLKGSLMAAKIHPELKNLFTPWNVLKDIVRRYVKSWRREYNDCGVALLAYEPLFLAVQLRRAWAYMTQHTR